MARYVLITSDTPDKVLKYLKRQGLEVKVYEFNPTLDLSDVENPDNGWYAWKDCDNFIEGIHWDGAGTELTQQEKIHGFPEKTIAGLGRGWEKFRCKAHKGDERFKWSGRKRVPDNNPKGETDYSYITCSRCPNYSPRTLKGRRAVLISIDAQYRKNMERLENEIMRLGQEQAKQSGLEKKTEE